MTYASLTTSDLAFFESVMPDRVFSGQAILADYDHDEMTEYGHFRPEAVLQALTADEIAKVLAYCNERHIAVTPRGAGTGLGREVLPGTAVFFRRREGPGARGVPAGRAGADRREGISRRACPFRPARRSVPPERRSRRRPSRGGRAGTLRGEPPPPQLPAGRGSAPAADRRYRLRTPRGAAGGRRCTSAARGPSPGTPGPGVLRPKSPMKKVCSKFLSSPPKRCQVTYTPGRILSNPLKKPRPHGIFEETVGDEKNSWRVPATWPCAANWNS